MAVISTKNVSGRKMSKREKRENVTGYLFILPYLVGFIIFAGIPFLSTIVMSFFNIKYVSKLDNLKFVNLDNYIKVFTNTETFQALIRTFQYTLIYVPLIMITGFVLAMLLNRGIYLKKTARAMFFLPYVSNMMAIAVVIKLIFGFNGPVFALMQLFGFDRPLLLNSSTALATVACVAVWKGVGLNMVTFLGALQGVPGELLEAAQIDGANKWQRITNVVIPMISPTTFFLLISSIITSLQNYTVITSLTDGGPGQATTVMSVSIVKSAFVTYNTSFACAQAVIMFIIVMLVTLIQWRGQKKWVNY